MIPFLAVLALAAGAAAQSSPGIRKFATVEGVTEYRLDNGLRAVLFPDPSKATTTVNIAYLAGSRQENYGETGMAHMIEHLVSYGSSRHPDAKAEQSARGASRNATTWVDRTTYYETFPASDENLNWALDLEADRMRHVAFRQEILDSQMTVVRNEWEAGENNPQGVLFRRLLSAAFLWHNYGKSTIGARSDIENVPLDRLKAFYDRYYHPNNAILIVAGKFEVEKTQSLIAKLFGPIPRSPQPIPATYTVEPAQEGERNVELRRVGDIQALMVGYHIPPASHPDYGPVRVLLNALAGQPHGRLYQALVPTKKAASIGASVLSTRDPGLAYFAATVRKDSSLPEVRAIVTGTLDQLAGKPVTKEEMERSRAQLLRQIELGLNDSTGVGMALGEAAAAGDWRLLFLQRDWIRKAGEADLARVVKAYFIPTNRTVGQFFPEEHSLRASIPAAPDLDALLKGYEGDKLVSQGEAFDPTAQNIEKRTLRGVLPSGVKFALLSKQTRGNTVHAVLAFHFGDLESLRGRMLESELTASMLMRGSRQHTRQQIDDELNRLKARLSFSGSGGNVTARIETLRDNLPAVLRLAAELLRTPAFPAAEFEQVRETALANAEAARREPQSMAMLGLQRHLGAYPEGDPRATLSPEERIAALPKLSAAALEKFHRDFYGASNGELVAVGDFDAAALRSLAAELTGGWKSPQPYQEIRREYTNRPAVNQMVEAPDKSNAVFAAGMLLPVGEDHQEYPALVLANYMLGGHSSSRLYVRIRGKEGLSYGVGSMVGAAPRDGFSTFQGFAIAAPQNVLKVEAAFREEIERAARDGFAADEVATAKTGWLQSRRVGRSEDDQLAAQLQTLLRYDRTSAFPEELEKKVAAVTPQQAAEALRRYLDLARMSYVKAGDFQKVR